VERTRYLLKLLIDFFVIVEEALEKLNAQARI
jgi:hypothetical protein